MRIAADEVVAVMCGWSLTAITWTIPVSMGCVEALCEDKMADLGKVGSGGKQSVRW